MPLNASEIAATKTLLSYLTEEELFFLAETVSQRIVRFETSQEAENVIVTFSHDFRQLLKRQKMKREYLLRFVIEKKLTRKRDLINAEKRTLVNEILTFTGSVTGADDEDDDDDGASTSVITSDPASASLASASSAAATSVVSSSSASVQLDVDAMAPLFAKWFYEMLNEFSQRQRRLTADGRQGTTTTTTTTSQNDGNHNRFGPHHFVDNCCLNLSVRMGGAASSTGDASSTGAATIDASHVETVHGGNAVAERLAQICISEEIAFNANVDADGCKGMKDPHGLVKIQISGTIIRNDCLVGVFDQNFGLLKELESDNWKIQLTNLFMQIGSGLKTSNSRGCDRGHSNNQIVKSLGGS